MKIHILGICGTFMGSLAILAAKSGWRVTGQDSKIYPPMSTQLTEQGIGITDGFSIEDMPRDVDVVVIGNVMRRGMPIVEYVLNQNLKYMSGPQFLREYILKEQHVLVVSGTHGKTTTSSILAWILDHAGLEPGFLIGGVPNNFGISARLGAGKYFVIEGDEYDCAFFDKRSKFMHYNPHTLIINNIEFDHADIFADLNAILIQFHNLLRTMPGNASIVYNSADSNIKNLFERGCWSQQIAFGQNSQDYNLELFANRELSPSLIGQHNLYNALAAIAAAQHVGINCKQAIDALQQFTGVKRRMEFKGAVNNVSIYSDFAHHPTAIDVTIQGLRNAIKTEQRLIALIDIGSNTMKAGTHQHVLPSAVQRADMVFFYHASELSWDLQQTWIDSAKPGGVFADRNDLLQNLIKLLKPTDVVLLMSNGSFDGFANDLLKVYSEQVISA